MEHSVLSTFHTVGDRYRRRYGMARYGTISSKSGGSVCMRNEQHLVGLQVHKALDNVHGQNVTLAGPPQQVFGVSSDCIHQVPALHMQARW